MKNIIFEMLRDYLPTIFTFIMTVLVATLKSKYTKIANDNIKKDVAATTVKYVEQVFKDIHGKDKLDKAVEYMLSLLEEKGITISDNEIVLLLWQKKFSVMTAENSLFSCRVRKTVLWILCTASFAKKSAAREAVKAEWIIQQSSLTGSLRYRVRF